MATPHQSLSARVTADDLPAGPPTQAALFRMMTYLLAMLISNGGSMSVQPAGTAAPAPSKGESEQVI